MVHEHKAAALPCVVGHKTNNSMLGVLPDSTAVESMMAKAVRRGMATGLVVTVEETVGPEATILELHVAPEDMGKVIGKQGRIAKAIRSVVRAATAKDAKPVFVEIQ